MELSQIATEVPLCLHLTPVPKILPLSDLPRRLCLVLGAFDGMHRGHFALFREGIRLAEAQHAALLAWSFSDLGCKHIKQLTDSAERIRLMAEAGAEYAVLTPFAAVQALSPAAFVTEVLCRTYHCAGAVCGFNFRFGKDRSGDAELLRRLLQAVELPLSVVPAVADSQGQPVSATAVRDALAVGDTLRAAALLGRWYSFRSPVIHGNALGRTIGIPTINQPFAETALVPKKGVYAALCDVGDGILRGGICNIGCKPTVARALPPSAETHILDYSGDLYGKTVRVALCRYLRAEEQFPSLPALQTQIARDIACAKALLPELPSYPV